MNNKLILLAAFAVSIFLSCEKDATPAPTDQPFRITVKNEFSPLSGRFAVFLSADDGKVLVYREIPGVDTVLLEWPDTLADNRFDCTVVKITTIEAPGSGVKDTTLHLTTYTNLSSGESINLRELNYQQVTDLNVTFTGVTSVDTIIVPDGLTFVRPQPSNNFTGQYRILHTGQFWLRIRINGQPMWRFILFNDVNGPSLTTTVDANILLPIFAAPANLTFPFTAAWQYKVDGLVDTTALKFLAMGDLLRAPGGPIPVFSDVDIFEPVSNDVFNPGPKPYNGFRAQVNGSDASSGGYTYFSDFFYPDIPANLPAPAFDLLPTVLADNRLVATQCVGNFDVLVFSRTRTGTPNINWEVNTKPANGIVSYRLPDVPEALGNSFPALKNYDFGGQVRSKAESYEKLDYESAIRQKLLNADPLWQAKGGYLGREELQ
ncbi:MAG: hypothetical protein EPGJADBJ_04736 [Saprospiraceae bacterium]|nr:hypothetical protein [Saprospiraceae bacterium]